MENQKSQTVTRFPHSNHTVNMGEPIKSSHIPNRVWRVHKSYWHLQGSTFHISYEGTYKSLTFTQFLHSNHIVNVGDPLQGSHIPYRVWMDHKSYWQLQGSHIPYKVWGNIRVIESDKVPHSIYGMGDHTSHWQFWMWEPYNCQWLVWSPIPYMECGTLSLSMTLMFPHTL